MYSTVCYTQCCVHLRGSLPLQHSTLTLSLNSVSSSSGSTLSPEPAIPSTKSGLAWKTGLVNEKKQKTNLGLWNLSQRREEALCNPLSSLCGCSCPKCFLQSHCNGESGFLRWSLCFWAIMKRGKAQTHRLGRNVMKPISWFREPYQLLDFSCRVSSHSLEVQEDLTSCWPKERSGQVYTVKETPLEHRLDITIMFYQLMDIELRLTNKSSGPSAFPLLFMNLYALKL